MTDVQHTPTEVGIPTGLPPVPPPAPPPIPPVAAPPNYPVQPAAPAPKAPRRWLMPVLVGFVALLIGAGIGFAASQPSKNTLKDQRNAAQAQVADLNGQLSGMAATHATCQKAATDAKDLADSYDNFVGDYDNMLATDYGSAAEATWIEHMNAQWQQMQVQSETVKAELADCQSAMS